MAIFKTLEIICHFINAIHCFYFFYSGEYDRNKPENEEQHFSVESVIIHPQFDSLKNLNHDIALLKLNGAAKMTDYVNTVKITRIEISQPAYDVRRTLYRRCINVLKSLQCP